MALQEPDELRLPSEIRVIKTVWLIVIKNIRKTPGLLAALRLMDLASLNTSLCHLLRPGVVQTWLSTQLSDNPARQFEDIATKGLVGLTYSLHEKNVPKEKLTA